MKTIEAGNIPLILCGIFYAVLCVFSIVTGCIYMSGKKELNPLELSDRFMERLSDPEKRMAFARKMGAVTFVVGLVQGITSYCIYRAKGAGIVHGKPVFSIFYKLKKDKYR